MVGVSGAGKSEIAQGIAEGLTPPATVVCADNLFVGKDGVYRFEGDRLPEAHEQCWNKFVAALERHDACVIVDNTNTKFEHLKRYVDMALEHGYKCRVIVVQVMAEIAADRSVHLTAHPAPIRVVQSQEWQLRESLPKYPDDWDVVKVDNNLFLE